MAKSVGKKVSNTFVWVLMALLVVGLMGFGTTQFNGGVQSVASVGDRDVDVNDYARGLDRAINNLSQQLGTQLTLAQAQGFGVQAQVMNQLLVTAALDNETDKLGLSAGDERLSRDVQQLTSFHDVSGNFDPLVYRSTLERSGLTVPQFEERIRDEIARGIIQGGVAGGLDAPDSASDAFLDFLATGHDFTFLTLGADILAASVAAPTDADLATYFAEMGEGYVVPETRQLSYVWITPEMLASTLEIADEVIEAAYQERFAEFNQPARRIVERLVFQDNDTANHAAARLVSGDATFESLVEERGLSLADVDLGDVTKEDLGEAGDIVFAVEATGGTVIGATALGPALFRINAIIYAQEIALPQAYDTLYADESYDEARKIISDLATEVDDLLASGVTLEELAVETDVVFGTLSFNTESDDGPAAYSNFRTVASAASDGDFPQVETLRDGGIFALRLDAIDAERPQTLAEARDALVIDWTAAETRKALEAKADELKTSWEAGTALTDLGVPFRTEIGATRQATPEDVPAAVLTAMLELSEGEYAVLSEGDAAYLVRLDAVTAPDITDEAVAAQRQAVNAELVQGIAQDIYGLYTNELQRVSGISLNQSAMNAVHAQFP